MTDSVQAREDWEQRIYDRSDDAAISSSLPAPLGVKAISGVGHIHLSWSAVPGAVGYVIERTGENDLPEQLRHGGSDVAAVPAPQFASTAVVDGIEYRYRIGAVRGPEEHVSEWSTLVTAQTLEGEPDVVEVTVDTSVTIGELDRVWEMIGAERLSQLRLGVDEHGHHVGIEFAEALRIAHDDLGVRYIRAHAILHDDLEVVRRNAAGHLEFNFDGIDEVYDQLLGMDLRPIVELSFMPAELARDPEATVFTYRGIISPPTDWSEWGALITALVEHLIDRYGLDEVATWGFEVWNEANLEVFWTGTRDEYLRLYDETARAIKSVSELLRVGGPSSAASEWVEALAAYAREHDVPLDFISTHTYGNQPLDLRPVLERYGYEGIPIWWTEWGVGSTHFGPIHDSAMGAPFILNGYLAVQGRLAALAYWVVSDHFEELGRPPQLFHDGFGLLTVGNLRKPRYWAVHLAAHQGDQLLSTKVDGDGAGVLVEACATRHDDGTIDLLVWNGTINSEVNGGDSRLNRTVSVCLNNLSESRYRVQLARVDEAHSNIVAALSPEVTWPDQETWERLRALDVLHEERLPDVQPESGETTFTFLIPMPGVARLRLSAE